MTTEKILDLLCQTVILSSAYYTLFLLYSNLMMFMTTEIKRGICYDPYLLKKEKEKKRKAFTFTLNPNFIEMSWPILQCSC